MDAEPRFVASYFTLAGNVLPLAGNMASPFALADRARAAAHAGYAGIGFHTDDLIRLIERHGYAGIKAIIADAGLEFIEIEALLDWFADGERRRISDATRALMLEAAGRLGAYQIKVVGDFSGAAPPAETMAAEFAALCRQAGGVGANVVIEVLPFSNIRDIPTSLGIVADAPANGGLLIDIWHMVRGGINFDDVARIPAARLKHIELDDADAEPTGTLLEDTVRRRKLPGQGSFDIPGFLRSVRAAGYRGLFGVEIVSDEHRARTLDEAAQSSFDAATAQFRKASAPAAARR